MKLWGQVMLGVQVAQRLAGYLPLVLVGVVEGQQVGA
jgi:hypothetical protein|tara:strand:+ start:1448 stop:1558 length:111 start_codon:yes stop_codon:yes gene_type:complete